MNLVYLKHYPQSLQHQIQTLIEQEELVDYLQNKYPTCHQLISDKLLRQYCVDMKNQYLKKSAPLSKVIYDKKIHIVDNALGQHRYVRQVQGNKLKTKNEIRISNFFKKAPEPFLHMIVAHELAHIKEKEHNKAFYQLCQHMCPQYHQLEFDTRVLLTAQTYFSNIY